MAPAIFAEPAPPALSSRAEATADEVALRVIAENVRVLMRSGALEKAAEEAERLVKRDPASAAAHLLAAEVYFRLGHDADLERHASQASGLDPASIEGERWRARLARWRGRFEEARAHLRRALERRSEAGLLHAELGALYAAEGMVKRARRHFRRALEGDFESPEMILDAALALPSPRKRNAALHRIAQRFPDYAPARAWAALCASLPETLLGRADPWAAPAEIPLRFEQRHFPVVTARLGTDGGSETPAQLLLDTGSPGLKLTRRIADLLGAKSFGQLKIGGLGSGAASKADLVLIDRLHIGPHTLRHVPAVVLPELPFADGLFHPKMFGAEAVRFSVTDRMLILGDNEQLVPEGVPKLSFIDLDQHLLVRLFLNGRPRLAMIDSGSGATVFDRALVRQIPERRPMIFEGMEFSLSGVQGEVDEARPVHVTRLSLGPVEVSDPILFEADLSRFGQYLGTDVELLLGADALVRFDVTFDFRNHEVALDPAAPRRKRGVR